MGRSRRRSGSRRKVASCLNKRIDERVAWFTSRGLPGGLSGRVNGSCRDIYRLIDFMHADFGSRNIIIALPLEIYGPSFRWYLFFLLHFLNAGYRSSGRSSFKLSHGVVKTFPARSFYWKCCGKFQCGGDNVPALIYTILFR